MSDHSQPKQSFDVGLMLSSSFSQFFANFWLLLAIIVIPTMVLSVVNQVLTADMAVEFADNPFSITGGVKTMIAYYPATFWLSIVISMVASTMIIGAGILAVHGRMTGREITIAYCFLRPVLKFFPIFFLSIVMYLLVAIVIIPEIILLSYLNGFVGFAVGLIFAIVAGLYLFALFFPFMPAILVENTGWRALARAAGLTSGYRWPIVGLVLILFVLAVIASMLLDALLTGIAMATFTSSTSVGLGSLSWIATIFSGLLSAFATGYTCSLLTVVYLRLIELKEGHTGQDLEKVFQ